MEPDKYVFIVVGQSDEYRHCKYVRLVDPMDPENLDRVDSYVYVINGMSQNDWPSHFEYVRIASETWEHRDPVDENVCIVNMGEVRRVHGLRRMFNPDSDFIRCNICLREFEVNRRTTLMDWIDCPHCGGQINWRMAPRVP